MSDIEAQLCDIQKNNVGELCKPSWNGLGNSINQITRITSSVCLATQTGF
jgi:hypothetical protein